MTSKKWVISFFCLILAVLLFIMSVNVIVDPFGYFRFRDGDYYELNDLYYTRYLKARHIKKHGEDYDAYLVGGSKAGGITVEKLKELDGYNYYNAWIKSGNFKEYVQYIRYILKYGSPKKILLHLSSIEVKAYSREYLGDVYKTPAEVAGTSRVAEVCEFLFKNLSASWDELEKKKDGDLPIPYPELPTGERNMGKYYNVLRKDKEFFVDRFVLKDWDASMNQLFNEYPDNHENMELCLNDLRTIKQMCTDAGVELQVIVGPAFITEMAVFETPQYWAYFSNILSIVGQMWDFSNYSDEVMNPYNFYNNGHYFYETGDAMIDTITGKASYPGFGTLLTEGNIESYLSDRAAKYYELQKEYRETGTIALKGYDDPSHLGIKSKQTRKIVSNPDADTSYNIEKFKKEME